MLIRQAFIVLAAALIAHGPASADEVAPEKRADIERLLAMTNALAIGKQMGAAVARNITQTIHALRPDIPPAVLELVPGEVTAVMSENIESLKEAIIPIYDKYFTDDELKEMIRFYSSDLGRKAIKVMPSIMQEGMAAGQRWGESLGPQINRRIKEKLGQKGVKI